MRALIAGASGLVGGHLLHDLLEDSRYERVYAIGRRELDLRHPKLEQMTVDFDELESFAAFPRVDDIYCSLGSTIKKAGSRTAFYRVDFEYVLALARAGRANEARQFLLVSSIGASASSRIFYSRTKGQIEGAVSELGYETVHIFRPSFLDGDRGEQRRGEKIGMAVSRALSFLMIGPLRKYRPIHAATVARAMVRAAANGETGVRIYESDEIEKMGR
jgi:uncharacterized protein YbjT (DUF2867 family)